MAGAPELAAIVVAVDPPVTATAASDACGIVVAGLGPDGRAYVIADRTLQGREPQVWARAVIAAYGDFLADRVVAEVNQGGDLVTTVLRADRCQRDGAHGAGDARQVAARRAGGGAVRRGARGACRNVRGAGRSDVRLRRRWIVEGALARPARRAGVGADGSDGRRRRPPRRAKTSNLSDTSGSVALRVCFESELRPAPLGAGRLVPEARLRHDAP